MHSRVVSLGVMVLGIIALPLVSNAQEAGSLVTFLVPQGTTITAATDVVIYIAQPQGFMVLVGGSCTTPVTDTPFPVQNVIVTDPGGGRATRFSGLITVSQATAVPNGTRVGDLVGPDSCFTNGVNYDKWSGTVR